MTTNNGFPMELSPIMIGNEFPMCRLLTKEQHDFLWKRNCFTAIWDYQDTEISMIQKKIGEYEYQETYYIYHFPVEE